MRKKINEMRELCQLKETKDNLTTDIAAQEIRISQLRRQLGKSGAGPPTKADAKGGSEEVAAKPAGQ